MANENLDVIICVSPYISAETEVKILEARQATVQRKTRRTAHQDVMNLTTFSRVLNHGTVHCARCLISREQLYLYTMGLLFVLQTHVIDIVRYPSLIYVHITAMLCARAISMQDCPDLSLRTSNPLYHKPGIQG